MSPLPLICHPSSPCPPVSRIIVNIARPTEDRLTFLFQIYGDIDSLRLPAPARPARVDGLWRHTCFEAFVRAPQGRSYFELNFSPSSQWAVYRFDDYRQGMAAVASPQAPAIVCTRHEDRFETAVAMNPASLHGLAGHELRLAVSAVVETHEGRISWWALAHPDGKPDFHHPDSFTLTVAPGAGEGR